MPNEKNKNEDVRAGGKKSVTRRGSTSASGARNNGQTKNTSARPKTTSGSTQRPAGTGTKSAPKKAPTGTSKSKPASSASKSGQTSKPRSSSPQQNKPKTEQTSRNRQTGSAREDYKRFEESSKNKTPQKSSTAQAKKNTSQTARKPAKGTAPRRKGKSRSRSKLANILTYAVMIFAFAALLVMLSLTVFFKIDSVKVTYNGREYYSEESIISLSGIEMGENIFSVPTDEIEEKIEKHMPYIEVCDVERAFPTGINIKVISANPVGVVTLQTGSRIILSEEGKSLEVLPPAISDSDISQTASDSDVSKTDVYHNIESDFIDETKLPEIIGLAITDGIAEGEHIITDDKTAMPTLKQLVALLNAYNLPPTKIDLSAGALYSYYDGRIRIKLGSGAQLETKIKMAREIILNKLSQYDSGRVDVSNAKKAYFTPEYMLD